MDVSSGDSQLELAGTAHFNVPMYIMKHIIYIAILETINLVPICTDINKISEKL